MNKKVFIVGNAINYADFLNDFTLVNDIKEANIVLFTGGEDVSPVMYNEKPHIATYSNLNRDLMEHEIFDKINPKTQIAVGICRGSQFLCVMNGGKLVQDVTNHGIYGTHPIVSKDLDILTEITSTHHQMQYPFNINPEYYKILFTASHIRSSHYYGGDYIDGKKILQYGEPEIVKYTVPKKPKCLAIQGHPEMMHKEAPVINILNNIIDDMLISINKKKDLKK